MRIELRNAAPSDAYEIVPRLRDRDLERLRELGKPTEVIIEALHNDVASFTATANGKAVVMFGLRSVFMLGDQMYLWMLGTRVVEENPIHFLRHSLAAMQVLKSRYSLIYGECAYDFEHSIRWLTWLGARVWAPNPEVGGRLVFAIEGESRGS